ncbi:TSUP family transporter [Pedosphaera parvula]|uniref:Probable membrane transporter protein n=1 Tax=Pedosphaera parvula (strain Ellin514) TaxID=320771 RepID=B9XQ99_PEDPL|nr:TSUP family transporter [Pedosphaera parvula]EEF58017.1 protein of unknown function DUF81 [Pedosphaera parvula Ellin514]
MGIMFEMSTQSFPLWTFPILFATGLIAGFVDSIAGGGGLITLPVWLSVGMPPQYALGTNKLQATFGSGSAAWHYTRAGIVSLRECSLGVFFTLIGAAAGTVLVQKLDPSFLKRFIPVLLLGIVAYIIFKPRIGDKDVHPRISNKPFYIIFGLVLGFYDGFFGPGAGSLWTMALMLGLGFNLTKATAYTKVMNLASNACSLIFFASAGHIYYLAGLSMGLGQLLGARVGSHMVVRKGTGFIRPIFISMVLAITIKLLYDSFHNFSSSKP